jgi:ribosomal protein S18 acetylase RimI-like enzyme
MHHTLRSITERDYAWLWALKRQTMRAYVEEMWGDWDEELQENFFRKNFSPETMRAIVIEGRDAGLLHVEYHADEIFLANIQIAPEFQNHGVGAAVVRGIVADAQQRRLPVRLQVLKSNSRARRLYERLGFKLIDETASHWVMKT